MTWEECWHDDARCLDADPDMFFPEKGENPLDAIRVCADCDVAASCLAYALEQLTTSYNHGVWGGTTPQDRVKLRRRIANGEPAANVVADALAELSPVDQDRRGAQMAGERAADAA